MQITETQENILARRLLHRGVVLDMHVVTHVGGRNSNGRVEVHPFAGETAATVFHDGLVLVLKSTAATPQLIAGLYAMLREMGKHKDLNIHALCNLLTDNNAFLEADSAYNKDVVILKLEG